MDKIKAHFKNNIAIYAVLLVSIVIILIALFVTHEDTDVEKVDTSHFTTVTLEQALDFFDSDEARLLVIGHETCSATINYVPSLKIAQAKYGFTTYYLELTSIDESQLDDYYKFVEKLDLDYKFLEETDKFGKFLGSTPMTVVIKNKKQVYGYIGSMNETTLKTITDLYGVSN